MTIRQEQVGSSNPIYDSLADQLMALVTLINSHSTTILENSTAVAEHTQSLITQATDILANTTKLAGIPLKGLVATIPNLPLGGNTTGDLYFVTAPKQFYMWDGSNWVPAGGGGQSGTVFPTTGLYAGLPFYRTDLEMSFTYNATAQAWVQI